MPHCTNESHRKRTTLRLWLPILLFLSPGAQAALTLPPAANGRPALPTDVAINGLEYRLGSTRIVLDEGSRCSGNEQGAIYFEGRPSGDSWQATLRKLAEARRQTCFQTSNGYGPRMLLLRINDSQNRSSKLTLQAKDFWTTQETRTKLIRAGDPKAVNDRRVAFISSPLVKDHDLADRGYARSELLHENDRFRLYLAQDKANNRYPNLVMVHRSRDDGRPVLDTVTVPEGGSPTVYPGPEFYLELDQLLPKLGPPAWGEGSIEHFIEGYHHGKDDRLRVLGPHYSETPILETSLAFFWDGGKRVFPYSVGPNRQIGFDNDRQRPAITMAIAKARFGPSTVASLEDAEAVAVTELEARNARPLPAEGPSDDYLDRERTLRNAAIERGLIYRNDVFWAEYERTILRDLFNRHSERRGLKSIPYQVVLKNYLEWNSDRCADTIKDPATFTITEVTKTFDGFQTDVSRRQTGQYSVPRRFAPIYAALYDIGDPALNVIKGVQAAYETLRLGSGSIAQSAGELKRAIATVEQTNRDLEKLFGLGCSNPIKTQLEEMLFYEAAGLDPAATRLRFANARSLSDSVYKRGSSPSFTIACLANEDFGRDVGARRYCQCVDRVIQRYAPERVDRWKNSYWQFTRDMTAVKDAIDRGQEHPDQRLYGTTRVECTVRR